MSTVRNVRVAAQWHVVIAHGAVLATYPAEHLAAAQEFARRTSAQAGESVTRVEQLKTALRPQVGELFSFLKSCASSEM